VWVQIRRVVCGEGKQFLTALIDGNLIVTGGEVDLGENPCNPKRGERTVKMRHWPNDGIFGLDNWTNVDSEAKTREPGFGTTFYAALHRAVCVFRMFPLSSSCRT
jgi:hypothetical protein